MVEGDKRLKLEEFLARLSPEAAFRLHGRSIDSLKRMLGNLEKRFINATKETHQRIGTQENAIRSALEATDRNIVSLHESLTETIKLFKEFKDYVTARHDKEDKRYAEIADGLKEHKQSVSQIVEEINDDVKVVYSKMGGGTMPRLLQSEVPSGTVDGSNVTFTVKNSPLFIEVSGQVNSVANGGFTQSGSAPSITITFATAPTQTPTSYFQ